MKKTGIIVLISLIVLAIAIGAYYYFPSQTPNTTPNTNSSDLYSTPSSNTSENTTSSNTGATLHNIMIINFVFSPVSLTIQKGDSVIWKNFDNVQHKLVSDIGTEIGSDYLSQGQTYTHTFDNAGNFSYHCAVHPSMTGIIMVE